MTLRVAFSKWLTLSVVLTPPNEQRRRSLQTSETVGIRSHTPPGMSISKLIRTSDVRGLPPGVRAMDETAAYKSYKLCFEYLSPKPTLYDKVESWYLRPRKRSQGSRSNCCQWQLPQSKMLQRNEKTIICIDPLKTGDRHHLTSARCGRMDIIFIKSIENIY